MERTPQWLGHRSEVSRSALPAAWARAAGEHGDGGGIFLSENGGKNWKQVLDKDRHIYDITIDPQGSQHSLRGWI